MGFKVLKSIARNGWENLKSPFQTLRDGVRDLGKLPAFTRAVLAAVWNKFTPD